MCHVRVSLPLLPMPDTQCVSASAAYARHPMFDPTCHMLPPRTLHTLCVFEGGGVNACMCVCVCLCVYVCLCVCARGREHKHTHTHMHTYIQMHLHCSFLGRSPPHYDMI